MRVCARLCTSSGVTLCSFRCTPLIVFTTTYENHRSRVTFVTHAYNINLIEFFSDTIMLPICYRQFAKNGTNLTPFYVS